MSKKVHTIAIYSNLPSGGARSTLESTSKYLSKYYKILSISEPKYIIHNFIEYLYTSLIISPKLQKKLIENNPHDILIAYHSWLTKTPSILRYSDAKKIYICHEPMREYYDNQHIQKQSIKEKFINYLRLPIKWLDKHNISAPGLVIVANSYYSKNIIDKAYSVNSLVIYPGIEVKKYQTIKKIGKENQVICVSAINKYKGQEFIVDILAKVPLSIRPTLILIGNGSDSGYLKNIIRKAKLLNVKLKVKMNLSEKEKVIELHKSKVFIYAPTSEPFGIVILEAIASGLPVLAFKNGGGYAEIVSEHNGIIMNNLDQTLWGKELNNLLQNNPKQQEFSKFNTRYAKEFLSSKYMNEQICALVNNIL